MIRIAALLTVLLLAACQSDSFPTPLESTSEEVPTSHADMMTFLGRLEAGTRTFTLDTIGTSVEGRPLVALRFPATGTPEGGDPLRVLIFAQQHGNEPSGKEAAIILARDIATGEFDGFLEEMELYLVPQVNPDGSEMEQRRNARDKDLNRDHLTLSTPEVAALHRLYQSIHPHVTLDVHEYGITSSSWVDAGLRKAFGQQIGALSNANMSLALREYAWNQVIPGMREALAPRDVFLRRYLVTDGPDARFRYSTAALNDGRNSMGILHSLSFLIEGRNGLTVESNIRERTRQQLETMKAFLDFFASHAGEARELVEGEKARLREGDIPEEVALVMDYVPDPDRPTVTVGVIDLETGEEREMTIDAFHPRVEASLWVDRPLGYVVPADLQEILDVLERHGIDTESVTSPIPATLESYRILSVTPSTKEDKDFLEVEVSVESARTSIPQGSVVVWCDQEAANLIPSLLEPQSQWGLAPLPDFEGLLAPGSRYPIRRVVGLEG